MALTNGCLREGQRDKEREEETGDKGWRNSGGRLRGERREEGQREELEKRAIL